MNQIFQLAENCKNWCCLKSWKSLNIVLAKILGGLMRCDGNGLIGNRMLNKERIIVIIVWQLCRAYSQWQTKTCRFSIHDHKSTGTDSNLRGHSKPRNSLLFHQLKSSDVVKLVYTLNFCDCPYIAARRSGTHMVYCGYGAVSLAGHAAAEHALTLIKVSVLILGWSKRIVTILWRVMLDCHRKWNK